MPGCYALYQVVSLIHALNAMLLSGVGSVEAANGAAISCHKSIFPHLFSHKHPHRSLYAESIALHCELRWLVERTQTLAVLRWLKSSD